MNRLVAKLEYNLELELESLQKQKDQTCSGQRLQNLAELFHLDRYTCKIRRPRCRQFVRAALGETNWQLFTHSAHYKDFERDRSADAAKSLIREYLRILKKIIN